MKECSPGQKRGRQKFVADKNSWRGAGKWAVQRTSEADKQAIHVLFVGREFLSIGLADSLPGETLWMLDQTERLCYLDP